MTAHPIISVLLFFSLVANTLANDNVTLKERIQTLINQQIPGAQVGIIVQDPKTQTVLFEQGSQAFFYPASNTKILTAIAALKYFTPQFQYQTRLHAHLEKAEQNILNDHIYLLFQGDPSFTTADLKNLIDHLKVKGITKINGNIVIDDLLFENPPYAPGWTWESIPWYYSAPVSTLILNENKIRLSIEKPKNLYDNLNIVQKDPGFLPQPIQALVTAVPFQESETECRFQATVRNNAIDLRGCWPIEKTPTILELAIDDPRKIVSEWITSYIHSLGIEWSGKVVFSELPKDVPIVATRLSAPLSTLLIKMLADSNNLYAESFTKALGVERYEEGSFQAGTKAILSILTEQTGLPFNKISLSDGSGQSRYNLITPQKIAQLLYHIYHDPDFQIFYKALSVNGKSGTLAMRMKNDILTGRIVGKTGTATGTSSLAGYFTALNGNEYIFSIVINQSDKNSYALKSFEDKLCELFIKENWLPAT